jgi:predicted signal transduction protein with EAL and GGDEF domain
VRAIEAPFELANQAVMHVGAHVGIAMWPRDGRTLAELMGASDEAMYRAKTRGLRHAKADGHKGNGARRALEVELHRAIEGGELELHYQVVRDLENGRIAGAEALVRWNHPEKGLLPPALFVELAEETGQIVQIDRFVMARAAEHLRAWRAMGLDLWIAVNVSARSLDHADFLPNLERLLEAQPELSGGWWSS